VRLVTARCSSTGAITNTTHTEFTSEDFFPFRLFSKNCEKWWLGSSCSSVRWHEATRFPQSGYSWNLLFENFSKILWENSSFNF
jgi:hypothetical protein